MEFNSEDMGRCRFESEDSLSTRFRPVRNVIVFSIHLNLRAAEPFFVKIQYKGKGGGREWLTFEHYSAILTSQEVLLTLDRDPRAVAMSTNEDFEAYLKLVKGGMTAGREQIYNFLKFDQSVGLESARSCQPLTPSLKIL